MPDTREEWKYLAGLYADKIIEYRKEMGRLKARINRLEQKLTRGIKP